MHKFTLTFIFFVLFNYSAFSANPEPVKVQTIKLKMTGSSYYQKKLTKNDKKITLTSSDGKYIFEIEAKPESTKEISANPSKYLNNDIIIFNSADYPLFTTVAGGDYWPLFAVDLKELPNNCYTEVNVLANKGASYSKKPLSASSLAFNHTMLEVNFIINNKTASLNLETDDEKRVALLLSGKVDYITAVSFGIGNTPRFNNKLQKHIDAKKIEIIQSTQNEIPCFFMTLKGSRKAIHSILMEAFLNYESSNKSARNDFMELGSFSKLTKINDWNLMKAKLLEENVYLKFKNNELGLKINKNN
jgi:hypothetical protein